MPFNGAGSFDPLPPPDFPAVAGEVIAADRFNSVIEDLMAGLGNCVTRSGESPPAADLPLGGRKFYGAADATADDQFVSLRQLKSSLTAVAGAGIVGIGAQNYQVGTVGAALMDNAINVLLFCTSEAQRTAIKAKTYADDHTALFLAAYTYADGRPLYFPSGGYKISAAALAKAGQVLFGDGWGRSVIRSGDAAQHLFTVTADDVTIRDLELQGAATAATTSRFAIFTDTATPARRLKVLSVKFSGQASTHGFTSAVKFDAGCDYGLMRDCLVERLWGALSGFGYGALLGNCRGTDVCDNVFLGGPGRGRHAIYLSGGANKCTAEGNLVDAFVSTSITQFSQLLQPPCSDNLIKGNIVTNGATLAVLTSAGISVEGHSLRTKIQGNFIINSLSCGIRLDGTGYIDLLETDISGNTVIGSGLIGIDLFAAPKGLLAGNTVIDSGVSALSANVRFISDGTTTTRDWLVQGNRIPASSISRSAFQVNLTPPVPIALRFSGNLAGAGTVTDYEFQGEVFTVDGMRQVSLPYNWAALGNLSAIVATFTLPAFADLPPGATVQAVYNGNTDNMFLSVQCLVAGTMRVSLLNVSGASVTLSGGSMLFTWFNAK